MVDLLGKERAYDWPIQLVIIASLFLLAWVLLGRKSSLTGRRWFVVINALLLTAFTVCCSATYPVLLSAQNGLMDELHRFENLLHQRQRIEKAFGNNRLWLVDVTHDVSLAREPLMTSTWESRQVVTDRRKLSRLLTALASDSMRRYVDLVVCDLTFASATDSAQDQSLRQALKTLDRQKRLLVAQSQRSENREVDGTVAIDADSLSGGLVDILTYFDRVFYSYPLFGVLDSVQVRPSLGYAMYQRLTRRQPAGSGLARYIETDTAGNWSIISHQFIPDYWIDNTDVEADDNTLEDSTVVEAAGRLVPYLHRLGELTARCSEGDSLMAQYDPEPLADFRAELAEGTYSGKKNVVFVGIFDGNERDMHKTAVGTMYGSVMLINALLNLLNSTHHISLGYVLLLLVGFLPVSYYMLKPAEEKRPRFGRNQYDGFGQKLIRLVKRASYGLVIFISEERAYLIAFVLMITAMILFNHLINIAVVEVYIFLTGLVVREFTESTDQTTLAIDLPSRPGRALRGASETKSSRRNW